MDYNDNDLRLIYILKIGYTSKSEGLYEFIFSLDESNIDIELWCWDKNPACDNAMPPEEEYVNQVINLKTSTFDLFCLHEAVDRPYMHGVYTIHALAYETGKQEENGVNGYSDYEQMFGSSQEDDDDTPLMVFHYGMSLARVKEILNTKKIILKDNEFIETSSIKFE